MFKDTAGYFVNRNYVAGSINEITFEIQKYLHGKINAEQFSNKQRTQYAPQGTT